MGGAAKGGFFPPHPFLTGKALGTRLRDVQAFSCVGVDFASPLFVKSKVKDDPEVTKVYIALFTWATSRAVYLELVPSLDAPTFLLCLRRFIGRRGLPKLIVSDNAKTFQASDLS